MGERLKVKIDELAIWAENPRHIEETEFEELSENDVINILISVVGYRYMFNLADDILKKGLMGNISPVVVSADNKYLVYDGNRRVSCIKILLDPEIIDESNFQLKKLILKLLDETKNLTETKKRLEIIDVYSTTREDALEIMDKIHNGISEGVGTIPWDAYQRDKANSKRNKIDYPVAFKLVNKLKLKKKDIKDEYTSYERIFANQKFKELFKINDYDKIDADYIKKIYDLLAKYKAEVKNNTGLSRIFNKTNEAAEEFFDWANPQMSPNDYITIKTNLDKIEIFKGQTVDVTKIEISILDYYGNIINTNKSDFSIHLLSPENLSYSEINTNIIGIWKFVIIYKDKQFFVPIIVKDFIEPVISLKNTNLDLPYGKSIVNLKNEIIIATNSVNESIIEKVEISTIDSNLSNNSFLNSNIIGKHSIIYSYMDSYTNKQVSETLIINVYSPTQAINIDLASKPLLYFEFSEKLSKYINNLDYSIRKMIDEINSLSLERYQYIIAASLRSLLSLLATNFYTKMNKPFNDKTGTQISNLCSALTDDFKNHHNIKSKEVWVNESTLTDNFRSLNSNHQWLIDVLNCGAHSSGSHVTKTEIESAAAKISDLIAFISILIF